ncbi:MAG TPA: hypothetical protein VMQ11_01180, partial [Alphaproteobacteria bacterium]|nr:hypothetical protein [Alphaproteobacteria bacterium]
MDLEASLPLNGAAEPVPHDGPISGSSGWALPGVWKAPSAVVQKSRVWKKASGAVVTRAGGEGYILGNQHLIFVPLTDYEEVTIHLDGGAAQRVRRGAHVVGFHPAGVHVRSIVSAPTYTFAAIIHDPEIYRDLAVETSPPFETAGLDLQAIFEDPQAAQLATSLVEEMSGRGFDHLLIGALHIALAVQIARRFHGPA